MHKKPKKMKRMMDGGMANYRRDDVVVSGTPRGDALEARKKMDLNRILAQEAGGRSGNPMRRLAKKAFYMGGGRGLGDGRRPYGVKGVTGNEPGQPGKKFYVDQIRNSQQTPASPMAPAAPATSVDQPPGQTSAEELAKIRQRISRYQELAKSAAGTDPVTPVAQPPVNSNLANLQSYGGAPMGQQAAAQQSGLRSLTPQEAAQYGIQMNAQQANSGASPGMRGGGLARKGVGQALAKGGLVKANGCAQRGKTKGKIV